jgi:class 3 adenylate cyclase
MDVGGWLRGLGLEQYEAAFRENAISEKVLPNLTAEDLKDLGVGMVGHRRMLLDAIAALRAEASAPTPVSEPSLATDKAAKDTAERRQVTVMFSDLVGSTALSACMNPEDLREVISAYQRCVAETVGRFGGFVAKYMGDGVLIYFGYQAAHEDDAERAVRAGLALIDMIAALPAPEPLQVRIGAATGMVVVGDLVGSGEAQERGIVGETPNLAARLQGIAEPNAVVVAEAGMSGRTAGMSRGLSDYRVRSALSQSTNTRPLHRSGEASSAACSASFYRACFISLPAIEGCLIGSASMLLLCWIITFVFARRSRASRPSADGGLKTLSDASVWLLTVRSQT